MEEAKTRLPLEVLSSSPALSRLAFKQFFFMDHDIILEIKKTERPELDGNLFNHIAKKAGIPFTPADINEHLKAPVNELVLINEFEPGRSYVLINVPPPTLDRSVDWRAFKFEKVIKNE